MNALCNPLRADNGWLVSSIPQGRRAVYFQMTPPFGYIPFIVAKAFEKQIDKLKFLDLIYGLPKISIQRTSTIEIPMLDSWKQYSNGWACKICLSDTIRNPEQRFTLWIKTPPIKRIWKWNYGRISIKVVDPLSQQDLQKCLKYFSAV